MSGSYAIWTSLDDENSCCDNFYDSKIFIESNEVSQCPFIDSFSINFDISTLISVQEDDLMLLYDLDVTS